METLNLVKTEIRFNYFTAQGTTTDCEDLLKNYFWQKGKEPENWREFDEEILIERVQSKGGNTYIVYMPDWLARNLKGTIKIKGGYEAIITKISEENEY